MKKEKATTYKSSDLPELSASEAVTTIANGDLKAEDYARALLDRCERLVHLNAFISLDRDAVLEAAFNVDQLRARGAELGLLSGLPIPLKDSICTSSLPTTSGTKSLRGFHATRDAEIWQRLSRAGAILLGKTNLHEMSLGWTSTNQAFGVVRNPYDPNCIPGGSSGGTAVAIAARMSPVGLGEDTNGSIRVPAAMCGIVGLRPTVGRYPCTGVVPLAPTLDTVGPMARSVSDVCLLDSVITGTSRVTVPADLRGVRVGVSRQHYFSNLDSSVRQVVDDTLSRLQDAGATLVEAEIPNLLELSSKVTVSIVWYEARRSLQSFLAKERAPVSLTQLVEGLSPDLRMFVDRWLLEGSPDEITDQVYHDVIQKHRPALQATWRNYFREHRLTAVVSPVVRMITPPIPRMPASPGFDVEINGIRVPMRTAFAQNVTASSSAGLPSIVLPVGMTGGLPVGLELDGPSGSDRDLLALGMALEQILDPIPAPLG